jgi:DNA-binding MarR family transcriptional regulator
VAEHDVLEDLVIEVERFVRLGWQWRSHREDSMLSGAEIRALFMIFRHHPINASVLAQRLGVGRPAASSVLARLREWGYIGQESDPEDRRRHILTLTDAGQGMVESVRAHRRAAWQQHLQALSEPDQRQLLDLLHRVSDSAKQERQTASSGPHTESGS